MRWFTDGSKYCNEHCAAADEYGPAKGISSEGLSEYHGGADRVEHQTRLLYINCVPFPIYEGGLVGLTA